MISQDGKYITRGLTPPLHTSNWQSFATDEGDRTPCCLVCWDCEGSFFLAEVPAEQGEMTRQMVAVRLLGGGVRATRVFCATCLRQDDEALGWDRTSGHRRGHQL
jgi:hypothetical protein